MKKLSAFCILLPAAFVFLGTACVTKTTKLSQPQQEYLASLPQEKREALLKGSVKVGDTKRDVWIAKGKPTRGKFEDSVWVYEDVDYHYPTNTSTKDIDYRTGGPERRTYEKEVCTFNAQDVLVRYEGPLAPMESRSLKTLR